MAIQARELTKDYQFGFHDEDISVFRTKKGLSPEVVASISQHKNEAEWMLKFRLKALDHFLKRPMPTWGADLSGIDFDNIYYYVKPVEEMSRSWDDVPDSIRETFDKLGIPEPERKFLAGVSAQYDSEAVYHNMGQFERTLIIAEEGSYVHYIEGCTAPTYSSDSLHSAVVEIIAHKNAH